MNISMKNCKLIKSKKKDADVIIIGAGIGGLTTGASLAKKGFKVKIIERLHQPGGYLNTFKRGDYWFEGSTHQVGGFDDPDYLKPLLDNLDLKIELNRLDHSYESFIFNKNLDLTQRYLFEAGEKEIINDFTKYFPDHKDKITEFFTTCKSISRDVLQIRKLLKTGKKIDFTMFPYFINYKDKSYNDLLNILGNEKLKTHLTQGCYHFLLSSPKKMSAILLANFNNQLLLRKPLFFKNGSQELVNSLVSIIKNYSGEIFYNKYVDKIILEKGRAVGIKLNDNNIIYGKYIVSNQNAYNTFNTLMNSGDIADSEFKDKLKRYHDSKSAFQIYLGLPFDLKDFGFLSSTSFFSNNDNIEHIYKIDNEDPSRNSFLMTNYSEMSKKYSPEGKTSLIITEYYRDYEEWNNLTFKEYSEKKINRQEVIIDKVKKITGLPLDKAEVKFSSTSKTLEFYSGKHHGAVYGVEKGMEAWNKYDNVTPIENLFLSSADTATSGSVSGTFDTGISCADKIVRGA